VNPQVLERLLVVSARLRRLVTPVVDQIVYASTAYTDLKSTLNQQSNRLIDFSRPSGGPADDRIREAVRRLHPWDLADEDLVRVGGSHDGGYLMAPDVDASRAAISLGVGPDVSWDLDIGGRGIRVVMFDPTVRRLPAKVPNGTFHRVGVSGRSNATRRFRPLAELVTLAGCDGEHEMLLKIDVEGSEWAAISSLEEDELTPYRQVVAELHDLSRLTEPGSAEAVLHALRLLSRTHLPVHVHANNYSRLLRFDDDWFPDAVEVSFVRRDLASGARPATRVRSHLDVRSDPRVEEIDLEGILGLALD
jgi:hypothetical protein